MRVSPLFWACSPEHRGVQQKPPRKIIQSAATFSLTVSIPPVVVNDLAQALAILLASATSFSKKACLIAKWHIVPSKSVLSFHNTPKFVTWDSLKALWIHWCCNTTRFSNNTKTKQHQNHHLNINNHLSAHRKSAVPLVRDCSNLMQLLNLGTKNDTTSPNNFCMQQTSNAWGNGRIS